MPPAERSISNSSRQKSISGNGRGPVPGSLAHKLTFAEVRATGRWPDRSGLSHDDCRVEAVGQSACSDAKRGSAHGIVCMSLLLRGRAGHQAAQVRSQRCPLLSLAANRWQCQQQR